MALTDIELITKHVLTKMQGLAPTLTYHSIEHTLDVVAQSARIAADEGVNPKEIYLLKIAALYHDIGFLDIYFGHEQKGCEIFLEDCRLQNYNLQEGDRKTITDIIMATKVPQQPRNLLEKIICDADLDYLGRNDYTEIAARLKEEFINYKIVNTEAEWQHMQVKFIDHHQYHTKSSKLIREPLKKLNLAGIR